ncbi:MAG: 23S rRNA methyltransferase [Mariprofundaceae bacterium]|nr:23S rRNA methyltransferase [Mariprofundaceae bacterium]
MSDVFIAGEVECLLPGGDALVKASSSKALSKTYLVRQGVPGDRLLLSATHKRRGIIRASLESIEKPSRKRVNALCSVAAYCGGCALQYLHADEHAAVKSQWVYDAFSKVMTKDSQWLPIQQMDMDDESLHRRRLRWHVGCNQHKQVILGFRGYQSHDIVEAERCMAITSELDVLRKSLQLALRGGAIDLPESVYAVQLSDGMHVVLEYTGKCMMEVMPDISWQGMSLQYWCSDKQGLRPLNKPVHQFSDKLPTRSEDIAVYIGPDDFVQGQGHGNRVMIEQVLAWSEGAKYVVDLFSGAGNLSLPLAASGMQVLGAEVNDGSVRVANANAKRLKIPAIYQQADLFGHFDVSPFVGADILLVDPPRKGAKKICNLMNRLLPKKVILVHCDVVSGGRDAQAMKAQGYCLQALRALDLFPYSGHVESMSLWTR